MKLTVKHLRRIIREEVVDARSRFAAKRMLDRETGKNEELQKCADCGTTLWAGDEPWCPRCDTDDYDDIEVMTPYVRKDVIPW